MGDPRVEALAVLRRGAPRRAERRPHRQRRLQAAARHVVDLRRLVRELVHDQGEEVAEHDVDDGTHAGHRGAEAEARDACLGDGRVEHTLAAELLHEPGEHLERRPCLGHVLPDHEDGRVAAKLLGERLVHRLRERDLARALVGGGQHLHARGLMWNQRTSERGPAHGAPQPPRPAPRQTSLATGRVDPAAWRRPSLTAR